LASLCGPRFPGATISGGATGMSYVKHVLQPDEKILVDGRISWVIYHRAIFCLIVGVILLVLEQLYWSASLHKDYVMYATALVFGIATLLSALHAWFIRWTTEIAVTNKRIIYKRGLITRHTAEMNMDKVASVDVDQSIWGRMFDYGSVRILGTGGAHGIERLDRIGNPLALRNAIDVR
jgi:uncharacterized membrane protein YdbT with pleckstrin-like domain